MDGKLHISIGITELLQLLSCAFYIVNRSELLLLYYIVSVQCEIIGFVFFMFYESLYNQKYCTS